MSEPTLPPTAQQPSSEATDATESYRARSGVTLPEPTASCIPLEHQALTGSTGRYRILRFHARGGLGEVFVAQDQELGREVALKRIQERHAGEATSKRRFVLEAALTGRLEHPSIVPVYGLVEDDAGQPCYAMRFIHGESLHEAIKRYHAAARVTISQFASLEFRQLLQRFVAVCNAVAFAHHRGIIHRDLKPANIMLGPYGETLVVDWGLAKELSAAAEPGADAATLASTSETQAGAALGTPGFMSPEQAEGRLGELGPAADIYSLGAVLYMLLTGRAAVRGGTWGELQVRIRHGDFPSPRQVQPALPRALEAVCLKAMAVQPSDRYGSALDLAADVERWLADEPVLAWREPWHMRTRRWLRRHRTLVTTGVAVLGVAVVLLTVGLLLLENARRETERQRADARRKFELAKEAVDQLLTEVGEKRLRNVGDIPHVRKALMENALAFYQRLLQARPNDADLHQDTIATQRQVGDLLQQLGRLTEAEASYRQALKAQTTLVANEPDLPARRQALAYINHGLGLTLLRQGRLNEAEAADRAAMAIEEELYSADPENLNHVQTLAVTTSNLGYTLAGANRVTEALPLTERARDLRLKLVAAQPSNSAYRQELGHSWLNLGQLLGRLNRRAEADRALAEARRLQEQLVNELPDIAELQAELVSTLAAQALSHHLQGRWPESEQANRDDLARARELCRRHNAIPEHRHLLGINLIDLAAVLQKQPAKRAEALEVLFEAVGVLEHLGKEHPAVPTYQATLAGCWINLGEQLLEDEGLAEAPAALTKGIRILDELLARQERRDVGAPFLVAGLYRRARAFTMLDRRAEADRDWERVAQLDTEYQPAAWRIERAITMVKAGRLRAIVPEAETLAASPDLRGVDHYNLAGIWSLACREQQSEELAKRALAALRQAAALQFPVVSKAGADADFDPLRHRQDYQDLLRELAKPKP